MSNESSRALAADFFGFYPHDSITLTYPLGIVTPRRRDQSLHFGTPAILIIVTIAAVCFIFLLKRLIDHRRHVLTEAANGRLESDVPETEIRIVPTYGQYLNRLRMAGCSQTLNNQATVPSPHSDVAVDMPPSYDMATKCSILNTALPTGFANPGYAVSESRCVLPPTYMEATLPSKDIITSDPITGEQSATSSASSTQDEQTTSISHNSPASIFDASVQRTN